MAHYKIALLNLPRLMLLFFIALTVFSCANTQPNQSKSQASYNPLLSQAQMALSQQQFGHAAQLFVQLSRQSRHPDENSYLLSAIEAYISANQASAAKRLISHLVQQRSQLSGEQTLHLAQLLLDQGKTEQANQLLNNINGLNLTLLQRIHAHSLSSDAFFQAGNLLESARERITLDTLIVDLVEKTSNQTKLLETLSLLSQQTLNAIHPTVNHTMAGWIELASILKQQTVFNQNSPDVDLWKSLYLKHPANGHLLSQLTRQSQEHFHAPHKVAVFLPTQGNFASAAQSIRKGISASAYAMAKQWPLNIHFYDTSSAPIEALYQQAVDDGVKIIIGPLDKANTTKLAQLAVLPVPLIALNKSLHNKPFNFYEFSLSPEDDVSQVLSLAWLKGHEKALILTPQSRYGERLASHFSNRWQQLGGEVLDVKTYPLKQADYSVPIKSLLQLDNSIHRFKQLRQRLNLSLSFEERRRHDADFIFLIASPREGRLIKPQLRFHRAAKLAVFSTSKIYAAELNTVANRDLDGVSFCDMPWLIEADTQATSKLGEALTLWPNTRGAHRRLMAMGYDAYQIIPHLERLRNSDFARFKGETGILSVLPSGLIKRQISCGYFKRGRIKSLGLSPQLKHNAAIPTTPTNQPSSSNTSPL